MPTCNRCGEEIEFRYVDGRCTPIHMSGGWCRGDANSSSHSDFDGSCRSTKCPKCGDAVFFIRHNGGSVWVDELGWPWPKHACFESPSVPSWFAYFKKQSYSNSGGTIFLGVVIKAIWMPQDERGPFRIILAVDGGTRARACLATTGTNTADYLLGRIVVVDVSADRLVTSNHEVRPIFRIEVKPDELGLPDNWVTINMKRNIEGT